MEDRGIAMTSAHQQAATLTSREHDALRAAERGYSTLKESAVHRLFQRLADRGLVEIEIAEPTWVRWRRTKPLLAENKT